MSKYTQTLIRERNRVLVELNYRSISKRVYLWYLKRTNSVEDSLDLTQDTYLRLIQGTVLLTENTLNQLVWRICHNLLIDWFRHRAYKHKAQEYFFIFSPFSSNTTESTINYNQVINLRRQAILRLPKNASSVYIMSDIGGLKVSEISKRLGMCKRTVENHLYKARYYIRAYMKRAI